MYLQRLRPKKPNNDGSDFVRDWERSSQGRSCRQSQPGGNVTGVSHVSGALATKRLEILRQLTPNATTIAMLVQLDAAESVLEQREVQATAQAIGQQLIVFDVNSALDIETAFATMAARGVGALCRHWRVYIVVSCTVDCIGSSKRHSCFLSFT